MYDTDFTEIRSSSHYYFCRDDDPMMMVLAESLYEEETGHSRDRTQPLMSCRNYSTRATKTIQATKQRSITVIRNTQKGWRGEMKRGPNAISGGKSLNSPFNVPGLRMVIWNPIAKLRMEYSQQYCLLTASVRCNHHHLTPF